MNLNKKKKIIFGISVFWVLVIFVNSLLPGDVSSAQSGFVVNIFKGFFDLFGVTFTDDILSSVIRSLAHFTEFAILGFLWMLYLYGESKGHLIVWSSGFGIALIDEIIQIFVPGRAFQVSDLMIDLLGVILGSLVVILLPFTRKWLVEKKKT